MKNYWELAVGAGCLLLFFASGPSAWGQDAPAASEGGESKVSFVRDVAPILVGNCVGCHNPKDKDRRAGFDLSTYVGMMAGGESGPGIVGGKPGESPLLSRVKGELTPKMPPGQRNLSAQAIERIETWIKSGAKLDSGVSPSAELAKIAPTAEELRQEELAKLSPEALDEKLAEKGQERWGKATAEAPRVTSGKRFLVLSQIPEERVDTLLKSLEAGLTAARGVLEPGGEKASASIEKISIYVFNDRGSYVEFVRAVEGGEPEESQQAHANLGVEAPYVAGVDPLSGGPEPRASERKASRKRPAADEGSAARPERTLAGVLLEPMGAAMVSRAGEDPPRWLTLGFGAFLAASAEPRSPYYRGLRQGVAGVYQRGWLSPITELLGGQGEAPEIRGAGFSLLEWLYSTNRPTFAPFIREMAKDGKQLDQVIQKGFRASREQFLTAWGGWVAQNYGGGR